MRATPSNIDPNQLIGLLASNGASTLPGIITLTVNDPTNAQGYDFEKMADLTTLAFPRLRSLGPDGHLYVTDSPNLTAVDLPILEDSGNGVTIDNNDALTDLTLPPLTQGGRFRAADNTNLTTVDPASFNAPATSLTLAGNALTQASVDAVLARLVAIPTWGNTGQELIINGGTNAAPSVGGAADKATLIARGATVTTN